MAEELGHIDIRFPAVMGGQQTGPLPTMGSPAIKQEAPRTTPIATESLAVRSAMSTFAEGLGGVTTMLYEGFKSLFDSVMSLYRSVSDTIQQGISHIEEAGQFSGAVAVEAALLNIQQTLQAMRQSELLSSLYQYVLRLYRDLLAALAPVRAMLSALFSAFVGTLVAVVKALAPLIKDIMHAMVRGMAAILEALSHLSPETVTAAGGGVTAAGVAATLFAIGGIAGAIPTGGLSLLTLGAIGTAGIAATATGVAGMQVGGEWKEVAPKLAQIAEMLRSIDANVDDLATDTISGSIDWAGAQLRQLAYQSPLYPKTIQGGPGGQGGFYRPPGSKYP